MMPDVSAWVRGAPDEPTDVGNVRPGNTRSVLQKAVNINAAFLLLVAASIVPHAAVMGQAIQDSSAQMISGEWRGQLSVAVGQELPLVIHVNGGPGHWMATLDSPAQGAFGLPFAEVTQVGNDFHFRMDAPKASFTGTLSRDGQTLVGTWTQGSASLSLTLARVRAQAAVRHRGAEAPAQYEAQQVAYDNIAGRAHLAGTLTLPRGQGPFPAVLLISGSGLQDRDETLFGHKPFQVWADHLTRRGIAVLRVDDRQRGGSTGEVASATTLDFAGDARASVSFLRSDPRIDRERIGLIGHSEGAIIATLLASTDPAIAFIVMLSGPGQPGEELLLEQKRLIETAAGAPSDVVEQSVARMQRLYDAVRDASDQPSAEAALRAEWSRIAAERGAAQGALPPQLLAVASPWMRWFIGFDPKVSLSQVRCPVLAIGGSKDLQVPADENLARIEAALRTNPDVTVRKLPNLNHLLQTARTGQVSEYGEIDEAVSLAALETVGRWISTRVSQELSAR